MAKLLNSLLFLGAILAIALVLSGYKETFELIQPNLHVILIFFLQKFVQSEIRVR